LDYEEGSYPCWGRHYERRLLGSGLALLEEEVRLEDKAITSQDFYEEGYQDGYMSALGTLLEDLKNRRDHAFECSAGLEWVIEIIGEDYLK
jgi:hypothetical protein